MARTMPNDLRQDTAGLYRQCRRKGYPASTAIAVVRMIQRPDPLSWEQDKHGDGYVATWEQDGFQVVAQAKPDYDDDLSYLGEFTNTEQSGAIPMKTGPTFTRGEYRYFLPQFTEAERYEALHGHNGMAKQPAHEEARAGVLADMQRLRTVGEQWTPSWINVRVYRAGIELGSDSLGGIDNGDNFHPWNLLDEGLGEWDRVARECADEAIIDARKALAKLCPA